MKTFDELSDKELQNICKDMDSKRLALRVAIFRHLNLHKNLAVKCMEELMFRKNNGDNFNFEEYINEKLKSFPPTSTNNEKSSPVLNIILNELKNNVK